MSTVRKSARNISSPHQTPIQTKGINSPTTVSLFEKLEAKLEAYMRSIIAKINESEERVMQKISEFSAELANLKSTVKIMDDRVSALEQQRGENGEHNKNVLTLCQHVDELENALVSTDVIMYGVPQVEEENLVSMFSQLCKSIKLSPLTIRSYFRIRKSVSSKPSPIIFKLNSAYDRSLLFKAIADFFKSSRKSLTLHDIGINAEGKFFVHECLPKKSRELIQYATKLKRQKRLTSAFTIRGNIYVRKHPGGEAVKVLDCKSVDRVAAAM